MLVQEIATRFVDFPFLRIIDLYKHAVKNISVSLLIYSLLASWAKAKGLNITFSTALSSDAEIENVYV